MKKEIFMNLSRRITTTVLCLTMGIVGSAASTWAVTASNTKIINTATLTYNDGTGPKTALPASVTVTVALVPSAPVITPGGPQATQYAGVGTTLTNTFTVTAAANGLDTYNLSSAIMSSTNTTSPTTTVTTVSPLSLGATVTLAGSTATVLNVPSDGASNASINGIVGGSVATVVIGANPPATVLSIVDNASGISTITLTAALPGGAPAAGVLVAEQKTVSVNVTAGTITTAGTSITVDKNLTATSTTSGAATATSGTVTDTFTSGLASLSKYVRNVTVAVVGAGPQIITINGASNTYYTSGVTAQPNQILEYVLVATNSGSGPASACSITDVLPTTYVAFLNGVYGGAAQDVAYVNAAAVETHLTSAADADAATLVGSNLTVNVGTGATNLVGGTIAAGATVRAAYQVRVNP
jgi:hypothetical protein